MVKPCCILENRVCYRFTWLSFQPLENKRKCEQLLPSKELKANRKAQIETHEITHEQGFQQQMMSELTAKSFRVNVNF